MKQNLKTPLPHPSLLTGLNFTPNFCTSFPQVAREDREWWLWSVHHTLFLLVFPLHSFLLLQRGLLSLHRSTGPASSLLQHGLPTGSQPPSGIHLLRRGVLHGLQVVISSIMDLHGLQGNLCSSAWSTSSLLSSIYLGVCRVVSLTFSHCFLLTVAVQQFFCPFKYAISEALPPSLMGSVLASSGSILEPASICSVGHRGSFRHFLTEATL